MNSHSFEETFLFRSDSIRTIQESKNSVPFGLLLADETNSPVLEVLDPHDADMGSLLLTVSTNFTPTNNSMASAFVGVFSGIAVKGVETTEDVLPVGTVVTGIGRLVKNYKGEIKLMRPIEENSDCPYILSTLPFEGMIKE